MGYECAMEATQLPHFRPMPVLILAAIAIGGISIVYMKARTPPTGYTLPPGPPGHWLLGNEIPKLYSYRIYEKWTQQYGPVFSLKQGVNAPLLVVIGRVDAALELLEKEGASNADRPTSIAAGETLSGGMRILLTRSGDRLKRMRRALHAHMQPRVAVYYGDIQQRNAKRMLSDILDDPTRHQEHAKRYAAAVVVSITYGQTIRSYNDAAVQDVWKCLNRLGDALRPGLWKVDTYPWLRYLPGYLRELKKGHQEELLLFRRQLDGVKERMTAISATPSFGRYLLENQHTTGLNDDESAYLAGSMFGAGSDTTAGAISTTILASVTHPEAQARVHEELDRVVGRERAPTFEDEAMLPQATAFVLESFRWRPVSAGGVPHRVTKDMYWRNYFIPAGSTIMGNIWAIYRDPDVYPDPEVFNPQRWLTEDGQLREEMKSLVFSFGFGRRVCPGQHIAWRSVFLNLVLTHWAFTMLEDPLGPPIDTLAYTHGTNTHPLPFKVAFRPRMDVIKIREMLEGYGSDA